MQYVLFMCSGLQIVHEHVFRFSNVINCLYVACSVHPLVGCIREQGSKGMGKKETEAFWSC